jgi:hypothetical protein
MLHQDICEIIQSIIIQSPVSFSILERSVTLPESIRASEGNPLVTWLEGELYRSFYIRPLPHLPTSSEPIHPQSFVTELSSANSGTGSWEPGWIVEHVDSGTQVCVSKDGLTFWVGSAEVRSSAEILQGVPCAVRVPKEFRNLMPGYYFAIGNGNENATTVGVEPHCRLYWHLTANAARSFISLVTTTFNRERIPFRAKVLTNPSDYFRADSGVLYVPKRLFSGCWDLVLRIHSQLGDGLRHSVPMFTEVVAPGVAWADDPSGGLSFGQSRCRVLANALWAAHLGGLNVLEDIHECVTKQFSASGLDASRPHLEFNNAT